MKRSIAIVALFVLFGALGSGWSSDMPSLTQASAKRHYTPRHHAHKAGHHHRPRHHRTV